MTQPTADEDPAVLADLLTHGTLAIEGQLSGASNATLLCSIHREESRTAVRCVYKPRRGERPLWDFPNGTLGRREVATHLLSEVMGWNSTPMTVWRDDGPLGPGMCQAWIDDDVTQPAVDVVIPSAVPEGWKVVLEAQSYDGTDVVLVHEDSVELKQMAVLDVITNNADRKGGHVLRSPRGSLQGIDHGLTFHVEPKLRTVLWGWAADVLDAGIQRDLAILEAAFEADSPDLDALRVLLSPIEYSAFEHRTRELIAMGCFPEPLDGYPSLPWPPL